MYELRERGKSQLSVAREDGAREGQRRKVGGARTAQDGGARRGAGVEGETTHLAMVSRVARPHAMMKAEMTKPKYFS